MGIKATKKLYRLGISLVRKTSMVTLNVNIDQKHWIQTIDVFYCKTSIKIWSDDTNSVISQLLNLDHIYSCSLRSHSWLLERLIIVLFTSGGDTKNFEEHVAVTVLGILFAVPIRREHRWLDTINDLE